MFNRELNYTKSFDKIIHFNMKRIFFAISSAIRLKRNMFILLIILSLISIILGVISAINFDGGVLPIDLTNIVFIRYLKDDCGVFYLFFGSILNLAVFYFMILLCCAKRWLTPLACIIYMYFVFAQTVVLVSIILIYGFFSTLILLMLLLIYLLLEILLLFYRTDLFVIQVVTQFLQVFNRVQYLRQISNCANIKKMFGYFLPTTLRKSKNIQGLL